jgi:hypothetical protein
MQFSNNFKTSLFVILKALKILAICIFEVGFLGSCHAKGLILQKKWPKTVSKTALIDQFSPQNCPVKRFDEKWPVQKDIIYI